MTRMLGRRLLAVIGGPHLPKFRLDIVLAQRGRACRIWQAVAERPADIKTVDHRRDRLGHARGLRARHKRQEPAHEIGVQAARVDAQQTAQLVRLLRLDIEGEPRMDDLLAELPGGEVYGDDGGEPGTGRRRLAQRPDRIAAEIGEQLAHCRLQQFAFAAEIVVRQRGGYTGAAGDFRHGDVQRAAFADGRDGGVDQRAPAQRFHSDLGHERPRTLPVSLIDWPINKKRVENRRGKSGLRHALHLISVQD